MSKRITARWYIGAWLVAVVCGILVSVVGGRSLAGASSFAIVLGLVIVTCGVVMFVMWIAALIRLARIRSWGWFLFVFTLYLVSLGALGIIPMLAYALMGPPDVGAPVAIRPTTT